MARWSWVLAVLCHCGARSGLDVPLIGDAAVTSDVSTPNSQAACSARIYAANANATGNFVVSGGYVYFFTVDTWSVVRVATEGTTIEPVVKDDSLSPWDFVADESSVWYSVNGAVMRVPNGGGASVPFTSASNLTIAGITANDVVVANETKQLFALSKQTATLTPFFTQNDPTVLPVTVVGRDDHIFWMTDEYVFDAVLGGLAPSDDDGWPNGLAMSGSDVYWTSLINGTQRLVHRTDSVAAQNVLYTGDFRGPLGANATYVYGVTAAGIARVAATTGAIATFAPSVYPTRLVVDGTCVYTLEKGGRVSRTPG